MITDERKGYPSASAMERISLCPGSWALSKQAPPKPPSADADSGTRVHAWLAHDYGAPPTPLHTLTPEEELTYHACQRARDKVFARIEQQHALCGAWDHVVEQRVWFVADDNTLRISAQPDLLSVCQETGLVVVADYKTGRGDVTEAAGNPQLLTQIVCATKVGDERSCYGVIINPMVPPGYSLTLYSPENVQHAREVVEGWLRAAAQPNAPRIPGLVQCNYCPARSICPEAAAVVSEIAESPVTVAGESLLELAAPERIAHLLARCELAEKVIDAVRDEAKRRLNAGETVPGWTLRPGNTRRTVSDLLTVFQRATADGVKPEEFTSACGITLKDLDLLAGQVAEKAQERKWLVSAWIDGCTEDKQSAPSLAKVKVET